MARIDLAQEKWKRNTLAAKEYWAKIVAMPETHKAYVEGIADFIGVSPTVVEGSLPAQNYREFARNATAYIEAFAKGVERAGRLNKWKEKYIKAFTEKK